MEKMEKQPLGMLARWKKEDMEKILVDVVGKKESYTEEECQIAYEWLEEKENNEKKNFPFDKLNHGILNLEKVLEKIGDEEISTSNIRELLSNVDRSVFFFLSSHYHEEKDNINESYSMISELVQNRDAIFARKKVGKKYSGPFKVLERERMQWTDLVKSEIEKLLKKLKELASSANQK